MVAASIFRPRREQFDGIALRRYGLRIDKRERDGGEPLCALGGRGPLLAPLAEFLGSFLLARLALRAGAGASGPADLAAPARGALRLEISSAITPAERVACNSWFRC